MSANTRLQGDETQKDCYLIQFHYIPMNYIKNSVLSTGNETHYSNDILGISRNIPSNLVDEQFGNTDSRAAPYCAMC